MRMRPALMSAPMVLASLADDKDVTRRLKGLEDQNREPDTFRFRYMMDNHTFVFQREGSGTTWPARCPYGVPGDGLWVRENFRLDRRCDNIPPSCALTDTRVWFEADGEKPDWAGRLRPSIHMPRWFSRLDLEIVEVHPERVADITERDALREGVPRGDLYFDGKTQFREAVSGKYLAGFRYLWDQLNPNHTFHRNPWVWVINFKRLKR